MSVLLEMDWRPCFQEVTGSVRLCSQLSGSGVKSRAHTSSFSSGSSRGSCECVGGARMMSAWAILHRVTRTPHPHGIAACGTRKIAVGQTRTMRYERETAALGGIARRSDLRRMGLDDQTVRILVAHGVLLRVRQAWYALPDAHTDAVRACEIGGRLACASALRFHGQPVADDGVLHVELRANAVARAPERGWESVRVHWSRHPSSGNRAVVDAEAAWRQWEQCRRAGR